MNAIGNGITELSKMLAERDAEIERLRAELAARDEGMPEEPLRYRLARVVSTNQPVMSLAGRKPDCIDLNTYVTSADYDKLRDHAEALQADYDGCRDTLKDERYCHAQAVKRLKEAASQEIRQQAKRAESAEARLREVMVIPIDPISAAKEGE